MSTIAIIIAGGSGTRMGLDIPKQFVHVNNKPVLVYTLESFQDHIDVDSIVLVCIDEWIETARLYKEKYKLDKLQMIVPGGQSGQESIYNGVKALKETAHADDIVIIHDGIRPLVDTDVLSDVVRVAREHGNAVTSLPYNEQIFCVNTDDPKTTTEFIPRETLRRVATPQAYRYDLLSQAYDRAFTENIGIDGSHYTNTMMVTLGHRLHFAAGSDRNIKLTTPADLELFKAYVRMSQSESGE